MTDEQKIIALESGAPFLLEPMSLDTAMEAGFIFPVEE
jgi:hypothetical protein